MSNVLRQVRREMARNNGTFVAKKQYRQKPDNSKKTFLQRLGLMFKNKKENAVATAKKEAR